MKKNFIALICATAILLTTSSCASKPQTGGNGGSAPVSSAENQPGNASTANSVLEDKSTHVTFGHIGLGIQTQIPDLDLTSMLSSNGIMIYPHGFTLYDHDTANTYLLSVEVSLAGETNLEQLPIAISNEKANVPDVNTDEKWWGLINVTELSRTSNVQIGEYQTVYFEIDSPDEGNDVGEPSVIGYSLIFEGMPVCVTAYYKQHKNYSKEDLQEYLQYMILTLAPYYGEAFYELQADNHIDEFYNNYIGPVTENLLFEHVKRFTIYGFLSGTQSRSTQNGRGTRTDDLVYPRAYIYKDEYFVKYEALLKEGLTYDGILPLAMEDPELRKTLAFWSNKELIIEEESDVSIYGIQMKRYEIRVPSEENALSDFLVAYTFIYEGIPYLWKMNSDNVGIFAFTEEEAAYEMDMIRLQADTMIRTIRAMD